MSKLLNKIRENQENLRSCKEGHHFMTLKEINGVTVEFICAKCDGTVSPTYARAYQAGLLAGAKKTI